MSQYQPANESLEEPRFLLNFPAGINQNQTPEIGEASSGYNFDLGARQSSLLPRKAFDWKATIPNQGSVAGICQLVKRDGTQTTLIKGGGVVYQWKNDNSFVQVGTALINSKLRDTYWSLGDYIIMADANPLTINPVSMWDGTTYQNLPTGLGSAFSAQYILVFNSRVWYFNVTLGSTNYPHMIVASTFENPQALNMTTNRGGPATLGGNIATPTGLEPFYILSPDLKAINGATVFQNVLIISTIDGQLFKLTGSSSADFQFTNFYVGSSAVGAESMVNIGNDVAYMRKGGNINLLKSVQYFGDVRSNDIARWIPMLTENVPDSIMVYDQSDQKVFFFIQNMVLVLFKDILYGAETDSAINQGESPWSVYTTAHPSQFNTNAAKYLQVPTGAYEAITLTWYNNSGTPIVWSNASSGTILWQAITGVPPVNPLYTVYWGDSNGNIYDINGSGIYDGGSYPIQVSRTSRVIDETIINPFPWNEEVLLGKIQYRRIANTSISVSFQWSDEYNTSTSTMNLKGPPIGNNGPVYSGNAYYNGNNYYSQGFQFSNVLSHQNFSPTGKGAGFYITIGSSGGAEWQLDHLELY